MKFPNTFAQNLLRENISIPDDLEGNYRLVFLPFKQWHQRMVDTWIPFAETIEKQYPMISYYELPTIREMNIFAKMFINEGMRAGIPNNKSRKRTITLYVNKDEFCDDLKIRNEDTIHVLILDREGRVIWRTSGAFSDDKGTDLQDFLGKLVLL